MVNPVLQRGISVGVAFHSSALHAVERKVVENAFSKKIISVVCATSTLSAGINKPANRVIIRDPHIGRDLVIT
jgi:replicative superfamily II helicase